MKAAFFDRHGGPEVLKFGDMPDPVPGPEEIVVDIRAASINGADWKVRSGKYGAVAEFPYVLGRDFSGIVRAVGTNVDDPRVGDAVFAVCDVGQEGAYAEKIAIKAAIVAKKPDALSHVECAALALTGLTALVSIEDTLELRAGETILIHGGAGGVASFAIQLAKHIGARVITTASAANHDYLRGLGADEIIDYNDRDFIEAVSDCDAVFDTVGGDVAQRSFAVLKPGGRAAFIASGAEAPESPRDDVASLRPRVGRDRRHLERVAALVGSGAVRVPEIKLFSLSQAAAAHELSEALHVRGKLVFKLP
jgi:NADPH:quinone reductase-like Zn-dependent oxidoreductase